MIAKFSLTFLFLIAIVFGSNVSPHRSETVGAQDSGICD